MRGKLWKEVEAALQVIVPICTARDFDGVDFYFLNNEDDRRYRNVTNPDVVAQIFQSVQPYALTPTGQRLNDVMRPYINTLQTCQAKGAELPKPLNIIVITDGRPSDKPEDCIVQAARMLDALDAPAWQIGIQFFQVGGDKDAANSLMELDDGLKDKYGIRDMVDTVPFKADLIMDGKFILKVGTLVAFEEKSWLIFQGCNGGHKSPAWPLCNLIYAMSIIQIHIPIPLEIHLMPPAWLEGPAFIGIDCSDQTRADCFSDHRIGRRARISAIIWWLKSLFRNMPGGVINFDWKLYFRPSAVTSNFNSAISVSVPSQHPSRSSKWWKVLFKMYDFLRR